jgi:NAD(P)-dependent dehydrogenase (short-subunit alcohol dehydrogenase family)
LSLERKYSFISAIKENSLENFEGKVAVVTGASMGIGLGLAWRCAREGMKVVLVSSNKERVEQAATDLCRDVPGAVVLPLQADVAQPEEMEALAQKTWNTFGAAHLIINNAGVALVGSPLDNRLEEWHWIMDVNFWGVFHGIRSFVPRMLQQGEEGHVVNISSVGGLLSSSFLSAYEATKHAVFTLSEGLYYTLKEQNAKIGVSVVAPGFVRTNINDYERNRPPKLGSTDWKPHQEVIINRLKESTENGVLPEQVADQVFEGIRHQQLYILTHPQAIPAIHERMENILNQRNPSL